MKLSKNFDLDEFTQSETADKNGIENKPGEYAIENLRYLCTAVLQPLRDEIGKSIFITSGFRSHHLNRAVGGVANSWHLCNDHLAAADITSNAPLRVLLHLLKFSPWAVEQVIYKKSHLHIAVRRPKREFLFYTNEENDTVE